MTEERPTEPTVDDTQATPTPDAPPPAAEPPSAAAPAYTPPTYTPPPVPPPSAQPTVAWAPPATAVATEGQRTPFALAAGILLVILGALGALAALALLTIGREFIRQFDFSSLPGLERIEDPNAFVASAATFGGILVLAFSTFYIVGGVGVIRNRNWGRVIGIVIGILAGLFWVAGVAGSGRAGGNTDGSSILLLVVHAYIAISLLFFWRTKAPA
jgi:hypothetical protein